MEIVVGLVLMATLLTGSVLALARHRRQLASAEQRILATRIADDLLVQLTGQKGGLPPASRGPIAGQPSWYWQTSVVGIAQPLTIPVRVIRFQIQDSVQRKSLVSVDVVKRVVSSETLP